MLNKKDINEVMGVPRNLTQTGEKLFSKLMEMFNDRLPNRPVPLENLPDKIFLSMYSNVGDKNPVKISGIEFNIEFQEIPEEYGEVMTAMSIVRQAIPKKGSKNQMTLKSFNENNNIGMYLIIGTANQDIDLIKFFNEKKSQITSSITHELKHIFDTEKYNKSKITDLGQYSVVNQMTKIPQKTISMVMFNTYYTSKIEQIVRNSEVYSEIKTANIKTKKEFLEFILSNKTILHLKSIIKMDFNSFYNELMNDTDLIKEIMLANVDGYNLPKHKDQLINDYLVLIKREYALGVFNFFRNEKVKDTSDEVLWKLGLGSFDNFDFIKKQTDSLLNKPANTFFKELLRKHRIIARQTLHKIYKLYAIINEE